MNYIVFDAFVNESMKNFQMLKNIIHLFPLAKLRVKLIVEGEKNNENIALECTIFEQYIYIFFFINTSLTFLQVL